MKKLLLPVALCFLMLSQQAFAQTRPVKGRVLDEKGQPVPGASVLVKGTNTGTVTDVNGSFSIEVPDEDNTLVIKSLGYEAEEVAAGDGLNTLTIKMETATNVLGETVVIGYGTTTRKQLVGAYTVVKEDAFKDVPLGSFTNMLQGKAPGVQITGQDGAPGATAFIRIRGTSSIQAGNDPLIVIDGVPSTSAALNAINSNDISDVTVLKDASTTAIYGSRGSNGVIMVTTRKGTKSETDRAKISYGFQYGWKTKTPDKYDMMNFDEKLKWERELGYTNQYLQPLIDADGYTSIDEVPEAEVGKYWDKLRPNETDWLSQKKGENPILRVGKFKQHDLSVGGGTEKLAYYFSGQIYDEDGTTAGSFFNRKSGNLNVDYNATPWLKIGQNVRAVYSTGREVRDRFNVQNPFAAMYFYNPYESPYDFSPSGINGYNQTSQGFNLVEALQNNPSVYNRLYLLSSSFLEINPIKNLTVRTQLGMQYSNYQQENFTKPGSILDLILNGTPVGSKSDNTSNRFNYVWTNTAEYRKTINNNHNISAVIGTEFTKDNFKSYSLSSNGFPAGVSTQENSAKPTTTTTSRSAWTLMSYFARAQYSYKGKYSANISGRRDGSSRFGLGHKWGNFIAGGASWILSDEPFLRNVEVINHMKLWGSLGTSGNNDFGNYTHLPSYSYGSYGNNSAAYPSLIGNEELTWEKNFNYSIGIDFALWANRIAGTFDVYGRRTHDLLLYNPISPTTGFGEQLQNIGSMKNNGIEVSLNVDIIKNKNFKWSVGGNFTFNKNTVLDLGDNDSIPSYNSLFGYYTKGQALDVYRMRKYAGVDRETGAALWYMADGSTTDVWGDADQFQLDGKAPDPKYFGGFYTNLNYKGFELGINFTYSGGNWTYNNQWMQANMAGNYFQNLAQDMTDYWTPDNKDAANPALDLDDGTYDSDRWLEKANYIRLRNVTLAYNLPAAWFNNKIHGLRVYIQGENLWYNAPGYHGDPEIGIGSAESGFIRTGNTSLYAYPQSKAITLGLNVTF